MIVIILVTPKAGAKDELFSTNRLQFVEQMFMLSSSVGCDPNFKYERCDFGHTLLCYLSLSNMFHKPTSGAPYAIVRLAQK